MPMIKLAGELFELPGAWSYRARTAPDRKYVPAARVWRLPNNPANRRFLLSNFLPTDFEPPALVAANSSQELVADWPEAPEWPTHVLNHLDGKTYEVLPHQLEALKLAWGKPGFAFFHEMGAGKSLTLLLFWDALFKAGVITEAWSICPNPLIGNWHDQIKAWTPWNKDKIKVYGILSLSAGSLPGRLVASSHDRLAVAVDESQRIKNAQAKRTHVMHEIGKNAGHQAILTGTSITKGIEDLYSQYNFLDPDILGYKSFYSFRNHYCMMGGFENKQIVGYQNLAELMTAVAPYTHVVTEPVKLPPMSHETRVVPISAEQKRLLAELKGQMSTEMAGTKLTVTNALTYLTRGAQILGGFFPMGDGTVVRLPNNNKMDELLEIMQGTNHKTVIFCRFVAEAKMIQDALSKFGCVRLGSDIEDVKGVVDQLQEDPDTQCLVSTYSMGSLGFTMVAARLLVKYSGTFNFEESIQSEKRIHRIGQEHETMKIDLLADSKLDRHIRAIADKKQTLADFVTGSLQNPRQLLDLLE